ncbi:hypothetical protein D3C81_1833300 [compost metagenome]
MIDLSAVRCLKRCRRRRDDRQATLRKEETRQRCGIVAERVAIINGERALGPCRNHRVTDAIQPGHRGLGEVKQFEL